MDKRDPGNHSNQEHPGHSIGGGLPLIKQWANYTFTPQGPKLWQTLFHKSACLSCAWGTGGQKGGFNNELEEPLQRCAKSVEAIKSELQPAIKPHIFQNQSLKQLQKLTSYEADRLGRLNTPLILRSGQSNYEPIAWD
ncbi:MAG: oxidoreductase, partial [Leptolyngbya sp. SIO3F4]|nr:oxidoreductase [Leptolyngbya sp. SIO3F4]